MIIPNHLQIEVVAGMCTADCIMCTIKEVPRKGILEMKKYAMMLKKFLPYISDQQYLTLHGMGEPLLDESLPEKIHLAKQMGFKSIGFATNATHLSKNKTEELLDSGLDTIIFSLDGMTKATHEQIRRGTNFDRIKDNIMFFIDRRNANKKKTKIIVRMIRQAINQKEWDEYKKFWSENLNSEYGDQVSVFDIHNWAVRERERERVEKLEKLSKQTKLICPDLIERFIIFIDGQVGLCCGDEKASHNIGNIFEKDPTKIYNEPIFSEYRRLMSEGRLTDIDYCKNCQIILSRMEKQYITVSKR